MIELLQKIVFSARTGDYGNASRLLNRAISNIQLELSKGKIAPSTMAKLATSLEALGVTQKQQNWVGFADIIEFELISLWKLIASPGGTTN